MTVPLSGLFLEGVESPLGNACGDDPLSPNGAAAPKLPSQAWVVGFVENVLGPPALQATYVWYEAAAHAPGNATRFADTPDEVQRIRIRAAATLLHSAAIHASFGLLGNKVYGQGALGSKLDRLSPGAIGWFNLPCARALLRYGPFGVSGSITTLQIALDSDNPLVTLLHPALTGDGEPKDRPYHPVLAVRRTDNPLLSSAFGDSALSLLLGGFLADLPAPRSFPLPANWDTAAHFQVPVPVGPRLDENRLRAGTAPAELMEALESLAESLDRLGDGFDTPDGVRDIWRIFDRTVNGAGELIWPLVLAFVLLLLLGWWLFFSRIENDLEDLKAVVQRAARLLRLVVEASRYGAEGGPLPLDSVVTDLRNVLSVVQQLGEDAGEILGSNRSEDGHLWEWLVGMIAGSPSDIDALAAAFEHRGGEWTARVSLGAFTGESETTFAPTDVSSQSDPQPVFHIDPGVLDFRFAEYAESSDLDDTFVHRRWLRAAGPAIQFARVADLAAELLLVGACAESPIYLIGPLFSSHSNLGAEVRGMGLGDGASALYGGMDEIFPDVPLGRVVRFLVRQALADTFISAWMRDGNDPTCVYEVFCWMATADQRAVLDGALGVVADPSRITDGELVVRSGGLWDLLFGPLGTGKPLRERWRTLNAEVLKRSPVDRPTLAGRTPHDVWLEFVEMIANDCVQETYESWFARADESPTQAPPEDWLEEISSFVQAGPPPSWTPVDTGPVWEEVVDGSALPHATVGRRA